MDKNVIEFPFSLSIIDAAIHETLPSIASRASITRNSPLASLVVYSIIHKDFGDLGEVLRLRDIGSQRTKISVFFVPYPTLMDEMVISYFKESKKIFEYFDAEGKMPPDEVKAKLRTEANIEYLDLLGIDPTTIFKEFFEHSEYKNQEEAIKILQSIYQNSIREHIYLQRKRYVQTITHQLFEALSREFGGTGQKAQSRGERSEYSQEVPRECLDISRVKDHNWDRIAVQMWWDGYSNVEIGKRVHVTPERVTNRISELRQLYGEEIVPYHRDRIKRLYAENT